MEKCVDSDYPETQYDSSKSSETWTNSHANNKKRSQQRNKNKEPAKVSRTRKKIAEENRSVGGPVPRRKIANAKGEKSVKEERKKESQLNVLKSRLISARHSVQNNTKIIHRNVPDRIGKYVNSSVRSETKLGNEPNANRSSTKGDGFTLNDYPDTKIRNECLSNKESVTLGNSIETVSGSNNIFEKIFDDCLDSTSVERNASSQETLNLETDDESVAINPKTVEKYTKLLENFESLKKSDARMIEIEKTPKKSRIQNSPSAPVKVKDHNGFYNRKKLRHVCGYCHKIFKSNGKLNSHVYSHTGERPFDCNNCGKAFSSKFKLVRHLLIHSEIRKFVCQICDRTFLRNDHLKNHYKIHDPQKKMYKCTKEHCDKEYSSIMSHKKHMAYHSVEDGDLKCLICNVKFDSKEEVLFHLKSHSGSRLFKSQSDKKFKCDFCDRLFLTRKDVNRHLVVHTGERDFLCQFCPQRFGRKDHLVRHIKKSHVNEGMKTEIKQLMEKTAVREESPPPPPQPQAPLAPPSTSSTDVEKDEEQPAEEEKTHIVITVKNPMQKKLKSQDFNSKTKSFRRDTSVPNKKQVPCPKSKSSTTQIFLENIPNILIIPNNSIILLRNQAGKKKVSEPEGAMNNNSSSSNPNNNNSNNNNNNNNHNNNAGDTTPQMAEDFLPVPDNSNTLAESDCNFNINYNYNYNMFQPQFPTSFPYSEPYGNYQQEAPFGQPFENLIFDALTQNELLKKTGSSQDILPGESSSAELHKKVGIVKPMTKTLSEIDKPLFEDPQENLIMNDSILSDFKVDDSGILDNDGGILNNLFGQGGVDATGNELLRNLLMGESPMLSSPLPGFSQIFNNSNAN